MARSFQILSVRGVPVRVHPTLVAVAILLLLLAGAGGGTPGEIGLRLLAPLLLFLTVVAHEAGHSFAAAALNIRVIDIVLTPLGGAARLAGQLTDGRKEALIAAAGPMTNLAIAGVSFLAIRGLDLDPGLSLAEIFLLEERAEGFYARHPVVALFGFNMLLGTLNLLPAFPLDGGRVLRGTLAALGDRRSATRFASKVSFVIAFGLCLAPVFLDGGHWWLLPFMAIFIVISSFKERIVVETGELLFKFNRGAQGKSFDFGVNPEETTTENGDDGVIDVSGRRVDDEPPPGTQRLPGHDPQGQG